MLFFDRGHARARAYIERARSAQAERQRESEELLHRGVAAFDRGDTGDARELLTAAVSQGASPDVALSYLGRLDRLEPARPVSEAVAAPPAPIEAVPTDAHAAREGWRRAIAWSLVLAAGGAAALGAATLLLDVSDVRDALKLQRDAALLSRPIVEDPVPVPRAAELALGRARAQFAAGHAGDALRTMAVIPASDSLRPDADRLRAEIQRALLAAAPVPVTPPPPRPKPMKCPKCGYIGFEAVDRCKNCGYEFSLSAATPSAPPELPMTPAGDDGGPLRDLALKPGAERARKSAPLDLDRVIGAPEPADDLPLFATDGTGEDLPPLVSTPAAPRRPLSVRRPTPDPGRLRSRPRDDGRERMSAPTLPLPVEPIPVAATASPCAGPRHRRGQRTAAPAPGGRARRRDDPRGDQLRDGVFRGPAVRTAAGRLAGAADPAARRVLPAPRRRVSDALHRRRRTDDRQDGLRPAGRRVRTDAGRRRTVAAARARLRRLHAVPRPRPAAGLPRRRPRPARPHRRHARRASGRLMARRSDPS